MRTERKLSELLQIMLDNKHLFRSGLCHWVDSIVLDYIITCHEYLRLKNYIRNNKPSMFNSLETFNQKIKKSGFYWKKGHIEPRIEWLNKHIKKQKQNEKTITSFTISANS